MLCQIKYINKKLLAHKMFSLKYRQKHICVWSIQSKFLWIHNSDFAASKVGDSFLKVKSLAASSSLCAPAARLLDILCLCRGVKLEKIIDDTGA